MDFSVSYEVVPEDYIDAQIAYNRNSATVKKNINKSRINLISLYVFLVLILYHAINGVARYIVLGLLIVLGTIQILLVKKMFEMRIRRLSKKVMNKAKDNTEPDKKRLRINEDEIEYIEKKRNTKFNIADIVRILESNKNIFIFWDESNAVILPRIISNDTEEPKRIIEYIRSKMEKKGIGERT
jgi:hypothetical protein